MRIKTYAIAVTAMKLKLAEQFKRLGILLSPKAT